MRASVAVLRGCLSAATTTATAPISSRANAKVKAAKKLLKSRRARIQEGVVFIEGHRLVLDAIEAGNLPIQLFYCEEALRRGPLGTKLQAVLDGIHDDSTKVQATAGVMEYLTETEQSQGVAAVLRRTEKAFPSSPGLVVFLDNITDPGNVGTLLRSIAGGGADGAILSQGCADAFGMKALRAGMGAQFRLPVWTNVQWSNVEHFAEEHGLQILVADSGGSVRYFDWDWTTPSLLVIGSEAVGPSPEVRQRADHTLSIPIKEDAAESLNAAMAGAIILFEAQRQRLCQQR